MNAPNIVVIAHNIRSTHNVGSIFRTCDGFGVRKLFLTGYTPYPAHSNDARLPHISNKLTAQISKTALGAEKTVRFAHGDDVAVVIKNLEKDDYSIVGLEQHEKSILLSKFTPPKKIALLLGEEVNGIPLELTEQCSSILEIPMVGRKESFNVSVAAGIALYALSI